MSNTKMIYVYVLIIIAMAIPVSSQPSELHVSNDEILIRESIIELYAKGLENRDFELIRAICSWDVATICSYFLSRFSYSTL